MSDMKRRSMLFQMHLLQDSYSKPKFILVLVYLHKRLIFSLWMCLCAVELSEC